jgi:hypothetical protein
MVRTLPADVLCAVAAFGDATTRGALGFGSPRADAVLMLPPSRAAPPAQALASLLEARACGYDETRAQLRRGAQGTTSVSLVKRNDANRDWELTILHVHERCNPAPYLMFDRQWCRGVSVTLQVRARVHEPDGFAWLAIFNPVFTLFGLPCGVATHLGVDAKRTMRALVLLLWLRAHVRFRLHPALVARREARRLVAGQ